MQGLCSVSVHLNAVLFLSDEMRLETCIICNQYHSLMCLRSPWQPIMDHFWSSRRLVWLFDGDGMGTVVSPGRKQEERWDLSFTCQGAGIASTWHGVHTESACTRAADNNEGEKIALQRGNNSFFLLCYRNRRQKEDVIHLREEIKGACIK